MTIIAITRNPIFPVLVCSCLCAYIKRQFEVYQCICNTKTVKSIKLKKPLHFTGNCIVIPMKYRFWGSQYQCQVKQSCKVVNVVIIIPLCKAMWATEESILYLMEISRANKHFSQRVATYILFFFAQTYNEKYQPIFIANLARCSGKSGTLAHPWCMTLKYILCKRHYQDILSCQIEIFLLTR